MWSIRFLPTHFHDSGYGEKAWVRANLSPPDAEREELASLNF